MIVERYSERYFNDVVKIVENFHKEAVGEWDGLLDPQSLIDSIRDRKDAPGWFLLIIDGKCQGLLYGLIAKSLINERLVFQEVIWYVNEAYRGTGVNFFKEVERQLREMGVSLIIMAVLENSKTEKLKNLYEGLGYKKMETHYVRTF
jgi:hypothetical protein